MLTPSSTTKIWLFSGKASIGCLPGVSPWLSVAAKNLNSPKAISMTRRET